MKNIQKEWQGSAAAFPGREAAGKGFEDEFYKRDPLIRSIWRSAEEFTGERLTEMCFGRGALPARLAMTALLTHGYSIYMYLEARYGKPPAYLGFSQGEFTALTAAGVFSFPDVLRLLASLEERLADTAEEECMYRIVDLSPEQLASCCRMVDPTGERVCISAYLSDSQNIVSGHDAYVRKTVRLAKQNGARWAIRLPVGRAFHSPLSRRIQELVNGDFLKMGVSDAAAPVYSCLDGASSTDGIILREKLSRQIAAPLQWQTLIRNLADSGISSLWEIGPGCTVSGNARLADDRITGRWIGTPEDIGV